MSKSMRAAAKNRTDASMDGQPVQTQGTNRSSQRAMSCHKKGLSSKRSAVRRTTICTSLMIGMATVFVRSSRILCVRNTLIEEYTDTYSIWPMLRSQRRPLRTERGRMSTRFWLYWRMSRVRRYSWRATSRSGTVSRHILLINMEFNYQCRY